MYSSFEQHESRHAGTLPEARTQNMAQNILPNNAILYQAALSKYTVHCDGTCVLADRSSPIHASRSTTALLAAMQL